MSDFWNEEENEENELEDELEDELEEGPVEKPKKAGVLTQREKEDLIELGKATCKGPEELERVRREQEAREQEERRQEAEGDEWDEEAEDDISTELEGFKSEGEKLDRAFPSMSGTQKKVPEVFRNELDPANEERRDAIIRQRVEELRVDARGLKVYERDKMIKALRKDLESQTIDELYSYRPGVQTDYQRLKFRVDTRLGRDTKTADGETIAEKAARDYPSMNNPEAEYGRALGLPEGE
ncbi:MAG: hypothetical protein JXQ30_05330 [Spirochaetes bacterium]|nr:hypothetical protein [Spirochaetota bacterium]